MSAERDQEWRDDLARKQRIELGLDAESFLNSKVGKRLSERAQMEAAEAMHQLKSVDPTNEMAIRALQNDVFRAESFELYINELLRDGEAAQDELGASDA